MLGFGVLTVAAAIALKFTGRRLAIYTAIITVGAVATVASLARMVAGTGAVTLFSSVVLVCVLAYHFAPALSRRLSGIRLPVFPSATSRWVFEARPDLPTTVVRSDGGAPVLEGPASVRDVLLQAERARSYLSGLLVGLGVLMIVSLTSLSDPHTGQAVKLFVVKRDAALSEADLSKFARERLAAYKVPRVIVFVDSLPKSGSGKIQWRELQEREAAGAGA